MDMQDYITLLGIEKEGNLNPAQRTQLEAYKRENPNVGAGGVFNFDFAAEAQKAYGELGLYYDRILKEARGDVNKALSRLNQDYETGVRYKMEDIASEGQALDREAQSSQQNLIAQMLSRGLYRQSAFQAPGEDNTKGYGIADIKRAQLNEVVGQKRQLLDRSLSRYLETEGLNKERTTEDLNTELSRKEFELEQNRRKESADMANQRGDRAYQKYLASSQLM